MDFGNLSQADKYLLYGLLLKRKRSPSQQRKLIAVIRSPRDLDEKIEAVMALGEEPERGSRRGRPRKEAPAAGSQRRSRKGGALVVDVFPEPENCCGKLKTLLEDIDVAFPNSLNIEIFSSRLATLSA